MYIIRFVQLVDITEARLQSRKTQQSNSFQVGVGSFALQNISHRFKMPVAFLLKK